MDNIRGIRAFVEVAKQGSFVAAAKAMNCSSTSISRLIRELEDGLGQPLLLRTTRNVRLSSAGERYLQDCENALMAVDALEQLAPRASTGLAGELKITTTTSFAQRRIMPLLPEFFAEHPKSKIRWFLNDDRLDLSAQGVDMAVRVAHLQDSSMVAHQLGKIAIWLVAAPSLLEREGYPRTLHDVSRMTCTVCTVPHFVNRWPLRPDALVDGPVWTDCGDASREVAIAGLGVAFLPDFMVEDAVEDGRLVRLFPELEISSIGLAVLYPGRHQISPLAAAFGQFLAQRLG